MSPSAGGGKHRPVRGARPSGHRTTWRQRHGLLDDGDFAFAFTDVTQAQKIGEWLAHSWLQTRRREFRELARASAGVYAAVSTVGPLEGTPPKRPPLPRHRVSERQVAKAPAKVLEARGRTQVEQLVQILRAAQGPTAGLPPATLQERLDSAQRWAQQVQGSAEFATVARAVMTWDELTAFLQTTKRPLVELEASTVEAFVHSHKAMGRAYHSLKWLQRNLLIPLHMDSVLQPEVVRAKPAIGDNSKQAPVLEPAMLRVLETAIIAAQPCKDWDAWTLDSGLWLPIRRAVVLRASPNMIHCWCPKGKQKNLRHGGFDFAIPRFFVTTQWDWWEMYKPAYLAVPLLKRRDFGMVFDSTKLASLTQSAITSAIRRIMSDHVQDPDSLTSYSARRVLPTLASLVGLEPTETQALSDWQLKPPEGQSLMPLRYSAVRYLLSVKIKLQLAGALRSALSSVHVTTWESISPGTWQQHLEKAKLECDESLVHEHVTHWASQELSARAARRFTLTSPKMAYRNAPLENLVPGKVVSLRLKGREQDVLCLRYQTNNCADPNCRLDHKCGILMRSGRTCAGQHPAADCFAKKYMSREAFQATQELQWPAAGPTSSAASLGDRAPVSPAGGPVRAAAARAVSPAPEVEAVEDEEEEPALPVHLEPAREARPREAGAFRRGGQPARSRSRSPPEDEIFNQWARERWSKPGHSGRPEPPTPLPVPQGMGTLWLDPLPTESLRSFFAEQGITAMVTAFLQPVHTQRAAGEQGHFVEATLKRGEGAYVHCLAGVHRGPLAAGVMLAAIHGGDTHRATTMLQDARAVELHRMWTGGRHHSQDNWGWATSFGIALEREPQSMATRWHGGLLHDSMQ